MTEFKDNCPTLEDLQEFSCGLQNPDIEKHLQRCAKCRETLEKEQKLNSLLDGYLTPPAELNDRILQACKDAKEEDEFLMAPVPAPSRFQRHTRRAWYSYAAAAALLVVGVLVGVLIPNSTEHSLESADVMMVDAAPAAVAYEAPAVAMADEAPASLMMAKAFAPVQEENLAMPPVMVADGSEGFSLKDSLAFSKGRTVPQDVTTVSMKNAAPRGRRHGHLAPIGDEVTHVWLADTLPSADELQAFTQKNHGEICTPVSVNDKGVLSISLTATDEEVQQIADKLYSGSHWKLLSPASPQPCLANRTSFNGHPVKYNIKVVPNK